jgi:hypothetical protein
MEFNNSNIRLLIKQVLQENVNSNNKNKRIKNAYNQIVSAVAGLGTDPNKVLAAIKTLQGSQDFIKLRSLFSDKRTGYNSFEKMVNGEYDSHNFDDIMKLHYALNRIGVASNFGTSKNRLGMSFFNGDFEVTGTAYYNLNANCKITKECQVKFKKELPKAITFWKNWLKDPITQKKVQKNWDAWYLSGKAQISYIFPQYFKLLNNLKFVFYHCAMPDYHGEKNAYAFVKPNSSGSDTNIYINCSQNDPDPYGTLIHEIQHLIYGIKPLNPESKIKDVFVTKKTIKDTPNKIQSSILSSKAKTNNNNQGFPSNVVTAAKKLQIQPSQVNFWIISTKSDDPDYVCQETEKMSNIMSMRKTFNVPPSGQITLKMLLPYIKNEKSSTDISWFLKCWALKGFPDLQTLINKTNDLALTQANTNNDIT